MVIPFAFDPIIAQLRASRRGMPRTTPGISDSDMLAMRDLAIDLQHCSICLEHLGEGLGEDAD